MSDEEKLPVFDVRITGVRAEEIVKLFKELELHPPHDLEKRLMRKLEKARLAEKTIGKKLQEVSQLIGEVLHELYSQPSLLTKEEKDLIGRLASGIGDRAFEE